MGSRVGRLEHSGVLLLDLDGAVCQLNLTLFHDLLTLDPSSHKVLDVWCPPHDELLASVGEDEKYGSRNTKRLKERHEEGKVVNRCGCLCEEHGVGVGLVGY